MKITPSLRCQSPVQIPIDERKKNSVNGGFLIALKKGLAEILNGSGKGFAQVG